MRARGSVSWRIAAAVACLVVVGSACGFRSEKRLERLFNAVSDHLEEAGTARFAISTTIDSSGAAEKAFRLPPTLTGEGPLDFERTRAAVYLPGQDTPLAVYNESVVYARRSAAVRQDDSRTYMRLDFNQDDVGRDVRSGLGFSPLNPARVAEFARGMSIGGVKLTENVDVRGTPTTRYDGKISPLVSMLDRSAEDRDGLNRAFRDAMGVRERILPASLWLDDEGLPRRIQLTAEQRVDRNNIFLLTYELDIFDYGAAVDIPVPGRDAVIRSQSFGGVAVALDVPQR